MSKDQAEYYLRRGKDYAEKGNYSKAIESFTKAIELQPDYAEAYQNRCLAYFEQGDNRSTDDIIKAFELDPDFHQDCSDRSTPYRAHVDDIQSMMLLFGDQLLQDD